MIIGIGIPFGRRGGRFTPEYKAILDRATALGYTLPSVGVQVKQNNLLKAFIAAGIWAKLDVFYCYAQDGSAEFATINWKAPLLYQNTLINSPTFTSNQGFGSNGTTSYIETNFNASTNGVNFQDTNACEGGWLINPISGALFGTSGGPGDGIQILNTVGQRLNMFATNLTVAADLTGVSGLRAINRTSATDVVLFNEAIAINRATTAASRINGTRRVLNGQGAFLNSASRCAVYFNGASLVSEHISLNNALFNYITSL
jgi:hypothetical protein